MRTVPISIISLHSADRAQATAQPAKNRTKYKQQPSQNTMPQVRGSGPDTACAGSLPLVEAVERGAPACRNEWQRVGGKLVLTNIQTGRPVELPQTSVRRVRVRY